MEKEILAFIATFLFIVSYVPQMVKGYRTKSMKDISMLFLIIISVGIFVWSVYAIVNKDLVFFIGNTSIFVASVALIGMKIYYDRKY